MLLHCRVNLYFLIVGLKNLVLPDCRVDLKTFPDDIDDLLLFLRIS
jgi:hypothetical protein